MPIAKWNDVQIHYELAGEGEECLLLIMGLGMDKMGWMLQIPFFSQYFKVIALDNRGVGKSSVPAYPYTTEMMADDAKYLLNHLGIAHAHVMGISMGGMIAQKFAIKYPQAVKRLALVCTYARVDDAVKEVFANVSAAIFGSPKSSLADINPAGISIEKVLFAMQEFVFTPEFLSTNKELIDAFYKEYLATNPSIDGFMYQLAATQMHDAQNELSKITAPTLVLTGDRDTLVPPSSSEYLAKNIPGAALKYLSGCGHGLNFEKPDEFNNLVLEFLKG